MTRFKVPQVEIDFIVAKHHVGDSDDKIRADIRARAVGRLTDSQLRRCEEYAVKSHAANRRLYAAVMGGRG
jgi:hypothetical protein